jgi:site-specific recombinase XerD
MTDRPLDAWVEGYLAYLAEVRRNAQGTVKDVRCTLKGACQAMAAIRPEVPLWKLTLEDYVVWIESERRRGHPTTSIAKRLSHLRGLLDYAWRSGRSDRNVLDGFRLMDEGKRKAPGVLSLDEARRLVLSCPRGNAVERRDRTMILVLYGCGLRTCEICQLNVEDLDRERQEVRVRHGKGGIPRRVPVLDGLWTELMAYLAERGCRRGALFRTSAKRARVSARDVGIVVKQAARRAGLEGKVTPKTLRHSFATHLMHRGVKIEVISELMGHRGPAETGVYLHALGGNAEEAVAKLGGNNGEAER